MTLKDMKNLIPNWWRPFVRIKEKSMCYIIPNVIPKWQKYHRIVLHLRNHAEDIESYNKCFYIWYYLLHKNNENKNAENRLWSWLWYGLKEKRKMMYEYMWTIKRKTVPSEIVPNERTGIYIYDSFNGKWSWSKWNGKKQCATYNNQKWFVMDTVCLNRDRWQRKECDPDDKKYDPSSSVFTEPNRT